MAIEWFKSDAPVAQLLFAHGAGAGKDSEFMQQMAQLLMAQGINVGLFNFEYMDKALLLGRNQPPQRADKLIAYFKQIYAKLDNNLPIFIGGKSMGGRMASLLACEQTVKGVIAFGYPFHPPKKKDTLRTAHFSELLAPLFIVQGERDIFGERAFVSELPLLGPITIAWIDDGDHSLVPRKRSGFTQAQNWQHSAKLAADFMKKVTHD